MPRRWSQWQPALDELEFSDLQSLLMAVYQRRARQQSEARLLARSGVPLCLPSAADARLLNRFDELAFRTAAAFEALDLAPACPLGTSQVLGGIAQNSVLTAIRNAEVPGDSTSALALECARRRRAVADRGPEPVRLCASHRVMRLQPFDQPGFTPHFRLFALVTAGRDRGSDAFEVRHMAEHVRFYLELFRELNSAGFVARSPIVEVGDLSITEALLASAGVSRADVREAVRAHRIGSAERFLVERGIVLPGAVEDPRDLKGIAEPGFTRLCRVRDEVFDPLSAEFPEARFRFGLGRLEGLGYYTGLCLRVSPEAADGERFPVADGGFTNWTARLLQDRKERLLTSGIGSEFVCKRYAGSGLSNPTSFPPAGSEG